MICSSSHIEGAFLSARESSMVISQSSHVCTGQTLVVHYVQRARKVGWGGVQLIRWEGGGWAADNSMAISQAGSLQLIDPPNCIPHYLTVSLPHILSCTSPIPSSWHHNSAPWHSSRNFNDLCAQAGILGKNDCCANWPQPHTLLWVLYPDHLEIEHHEDQTHRHQRQSKTKWCPCTRAPYPVRVTVRAFCTQLEQNIGSEETQQNSSVATHTYIVIIVMQMEQ